MKRLRRRCLFAPAVLLAGCLSSAPPAPPVRFFDPLPEPSAATPRGDAKVALRVVAAPHLGREFAVRTADRELVFDAQHSWILPPRDLVAAALERICGLADPGAVVVEVYVAAFEIDVTGPPQAHVRLLRRAPGRPMGEIDARVPVVGAAPGGYAAAMAEALASAAQSCVADLDDEAGGLRQGASAR